MENELDSELIPVRLSEEEWHAVTLAYISAAFRPESVRVYLDAITDGKSYSDAAYDAIRNEAVNEFLEQALDELDRLKQEKQQGEPSNDNTGIV